MCLLAGLGLVAAISMVPVLCETQVPGGSPRAEASSDGWAGANVREIAEKLRECDFYSGEIDWYTIAQIALGVLSRKK